PISSDTQAYIGGTDSQGTNTRVVGQHSITVKASDVIHPAPAINPLNATDQDTANILVGQGTGSFGLSVGGSVAVLTVGSGVSAQVLDGTTLQSSGAITVD